MIFENVQKLAKDRNISIQKLEQECGLSAGIINKWRANNNPKVDNLKKVADFFGVDIGELMK